MALDTWTALLAAYLVGGITFFPLIIILIIAHGCFALPYRYDVQLQNGDEDEIVQPGDDATPLEAAKAGTKGETKPSSNQDSEVASGYFAVHREYDPTGIIAKPMERSTPVTSTVTTPSPSVYQTMYRSIFDRKPVAGPIVGSNGVGQRPKKAGNLFYVVLRHGHLILFDDADQLEVRHVISLAHHDIGIYSGGGTTPEGELFIKRNALCLVRRQDSAERSSNGQVSKPFYLFSENCSAKEDFYFALLKNQQQTFGTGNNAPTPKQFELRSIISLVQKLHSSEDQVHSRWLNAILGRLFLGVYRTCDLENFIREKITKKISRVKRPSYLANIKIQKIDTGDAAPYLSNLRLKDLTVEGECLVEADVRYTGNFRIEVAATAKIDLGARFKTREVNLILAVVMKRLEGHVLFKIKPPPSNRVWFSFQVMPKLEMVIEPVVSSRQITYTVITRQIENRIKEVFAETLVQPFWDDVPFFKTEHKKWRGGIFEGDDVVEPSFEGPETAAQVGDVDAADLLDLTDARLMEKCQAIPAMEPHQTVPQLLARKPGKVGAMPSASVSSIGLDMAASTGKAPLRSPNIIKPTTEPLVGTEAAHADLFKPSASPPDHASNSMAALHSRSQGALPRSASSGSLGKPPAHVNTASRSSSLSKEGPNGPDREGINSKLVGPVLRRNTASSVGSGLSGESTGPQSPTNSVTMPFKNQGGSLGRNFLLRREDSNASFSTGSTDGDNAAQKRNTLAAVTNAAAQARQWGWNVLQRQREAMRNGDKASAVDLSQPMGRGQPLPPPGTPLPGPVSSKNKMLPISAPKRKPVPPPAAESDTVEAEARSVASPSLPQRRRRSNSRMPDANHDQIILVVAAPDDSQPGTPTSEDSPNYTGLWIGDLHTEARPVSVPVKPTTFPASHDAAAMSSLPLQPESNTVSNGYAMAKPPSVTATFKGQNENDADDVYSAWKEDADPEAKPGQKSDLPAALS